MAFISLPTQAPGILGPMAYRPDTAVHLNALAESLLRGPASLSQGERETIAAWTSHRNGCRFCTKSHAAAARAWLEERSADLDRLLETNDTSHFNGKMQALLALSAALQENVQGVTPQHVESARAAGASDEDIHDTVLITAAFCMYNRYVDGLGTAEAPQEAYAPMGQMLKERGYVHASM
ncbi:MAG: peroxidase-related enzyme [Silvanigrellales bacterium]|nr:peroxidase-related enzyme [Silvanigrellales bacterium]